MTPTFSRHLVRAARDRLGLSQQEAAERASLTRQTVQNIEKGRRAPMGYVLAALAAVYGVTIDSFFVDEDEAEAAGVGASLHDETSTTNGESRGRHEATDTEATPPATRQNREGAAQ